jgi:hypothetical protein
MSPYPISNAHAPLNNVNGSLVNIDDSHTGGIPFSNTIVPTGIHTLPAPGSNIQSAASIYPGSQKGGKINRKKINKISRKYKMKGSKKSVTRRIRRIKTRVRSKYARKHSRRHTKRRSQRGGISSRRFMSGGAAVAPNYPAGHTQYDLNKMISNTYSLGGQLDSGLSALASPPPFQKGAAQVDNLNHNATNSYGNTGAGSGFPSRGWF